MIVGTVFIGMVIITGFTDPFTEFLDQATYLVGGTLLFIFSALLWSVQNLIDSVNNIHERIRIVLNNHDRLTASTIAPSRSPSKYAATDFEGIPRKPGESGADYWDRVEKETNKTKG